MAARVAAGAQAKSRSEGPLPAARLARLGLAAVLAGYCALATAQSFATRLQWGPDEPAHIIYVRSLALDRRLPAPAAGEAEDRYLPGAARSHQAHHPPLYYALAALVWRAFAGWPDQIVSYRDERTGEAVTYRVPGPVRPVRFLSIAFGLGALAFVWATARLVFPRRPALWPASAALLGFTPMFTYLTSVISNDPLVALLFAMAAWRWARAMRHGCSYADAALVGLISGAAISTKETGLALVPLSALALALAPGARSWRERAGWIAAAAAVAAVAGGWWYVRKWAVFGHPFLYAYHAPLSDLPPQQAARVRAALPELVFAFTFVPFDVIARTADANLVFGFFGAGVAVSLVGLLLALARQREEPMSALEIQSIGLWLLAGALILAGLVRNIFLVDWRMGTAGGRFLVAALPMLVLASARGLSGLSRRPGRGNLWLGAACALLLGMNIYVIRAVAAAYGTLGL